MSSLLNEALPNLLLAGAIGALFGAAVLALHAWRDRRRLLVKSLLPGMVNTVYYLTGGGGRSEWYFDYDEVAARPQSLARSVKWLVDTIESLRQSERVTHLVFMERDSGPIGMLGAKDLLSQRTGLPTTVYRELRELKPAQWKGARLDNDARVIVVSDVATGGRSTTKVIEELRQQFDCKCIAVLVVVDREEGAREALERLGVRLISATRSSELLVQREGGHRDRGEEEQNPLRADV